MRLFLLPDPSYHTISGNSDPQIDRFQPIVIGEFFVEFTKFRESYARELLLFDVTAVSAGFQLNALLPERG